jgi:hypothetical protein
MLCGQAAVLDGLAFDPLTFAQDVLRTFSAGAFASVETFAGSDVFLIFAPWSATMSQKYSVLNPTQIIPLSC